MPNFPKQWHLHIVDLEPRVRTKPGKQRPCIAVQPNEFCDAGLKSTVVIPLTTNTISDAYPLRIRIPKGTCKLSKDSDALIDQILAWDNLLFAEDLGELPEAIQMEIKSALKEFLDL